MSFLKGLGKELDSLGKTISKEVDYIAGSASHAYDEHRTSPILEQFRSGNVIQLVSRSSGRCLQIVVAPTGQLVIDGQGMEGPQVYHAHWTVVDEGKNIVKLHNNNNFLAIINGITQVVNYGQNPMAAGKECKFRLSQTGQFVRLESFAERDRCVGVLASGEIKSALATGKENDSNFGVRLIYKYQPPPPQGATSQTVYVQPGSTVHVVRK